jgi:hypothetical protein
VKYVFFPTAAKVWVKRHSLVSLLITATLAIFLIAGGMQSHSVTLVSNDKPKNDAKTSLLGVKTGISANQPSNAAPSSNPQATPGANNTSNPSSLNKTSKQSTPLNSLGAYPSVVTPALILSSNSITLHKLSATDGGNAQLSITSNVGAITQPIGSNYQKTVALENSGTAPYPNLFRTQWNYTVKRIVNSSYGSDGIDFTAQTADGKTITAHLNVTIEPIPSFTVTKGPLTHTTNPDGTVTYTAHITINPGPYFGNPQFQCNVSQDFTYNGNNNLSMSRIAPAPSNGGYFDITIFIEGIYADGSTKIYWHEDY